MINEAFFVAHTLATIFFCLGALKLGKNTLIATLCLFGVLSNLFIAKQITLFGFDVTCSDVYAVGGILCLNLIQEFFGKERIVKTIWASFFCLLLFLVMSQLHIWYTPNHFDTAHVHYNAILSLMPRIAAASITTYLIVQLVDARVFSLLQKRFLGKFFALRTALSLTLSQTLDTILFSFLGLYGIVGSLLHIIVVSLIIKFCIIGLSIPLIGLAKKIVPKQ